MAAEQEARRRGPYRMSKKLELALESIASGAATGLTEAAQISGLSRRALAYAIKKDPVKNWLRDRIAATLSLGAVPAAQAMLALLRSSNEMSKFRSASWLLQTSGFGPVENRAPLVSVNVTSGYCIDLRSDEERALPLSADDQTALAESRAGVTLLGSKRDALAARIEGKSFEIDDGDS